MKDTAFLKSFVGAWVLAGTGLAKKGTLELKDEVVSFTTTNGEVLFSAPLASIVLVKRTLLNAFLLQLVVGGNTYRFTFSRFGYGKASMLAASKSDTEKYDRWRAALTSTSPN